MKKIGIATNEELENALLGVVSDLKDGRMTVEEARAMAQLFHGILKSQAQAMEHAKLTGRLQSGSNVLPAMIRGR